MIEFCLLCIGTRVSDGGTVQCAFNSLSLDEGETFVIVTISVLCDVLKSEMELAERDLVHASVKAPMYGVMQSILAALEESVKVYG